MEPCEIIKPWVNDLSKAKTRQEVDEIGKEASKILSPDWLKKDFLEMARKRWYQLDA